MVGKTSTKLYMPSKMIACEPVASPLATPSTPRRTVKAIENLRVPCSVIAGIYRASSEPSQCCRRTNVRLRPTVRIPKVGAEVPVNQMRRSRLGAFSSAGLWLCAILASTPGSALPLLDSLPDLSTLSNRLELTPEQETQLVPLFEKRKSELRQTQALLEQASTPQQQRDVLREAEVAGKEFNSQVERVLTPTQQHEWREFRSELQEKAKERIEEKRE